MKDPTRTPEPTVRKRPTKIHHPAKDSAMHSKAIQYGYCDRYADIIGVACELVRDREKPVAFDMNKTRRKMVMPTVKGTYK